MSRKTAGELGTRISRLLYILSMFQTLGSKVGMAIPWLSMVIYPSLFGAQVPAKPVLFQ